MEHRVRFVDDELIPDGRLWLLCERGGARTLYIRRSATQMTDREKELALESAWGGFMNLLAAEAVPQQRIPA